MRSRLAYLLLTSAVLGTNSLAQQIISDVIVRDASVNDEYGGQTSCGVNGQVYRVPGGGTTSVMRVSTDGTTLLFQLPDHAHPQLIAATGTHLNILSMESLPGGRGVKFQIHHFDSQANLLATNQGTFPIQPAAMVILPSGRTVLIGSHSNPDSLAERTYAFAILDDRDKFVRSIDLPPSPGGSAWTFTEWRLAAMDGVAYAVLRTENPSQTAIAAMSEKLELTIKMIDTPPDSELRHHNQWMFGPGVAVEIYHYKNDTPHSVDHFDEYDLKTGEKIATKSSPGTGFQFGCYMGDKFSMLAHSVHADPARHLPPDALRLVTARLQ